MFKMNVDATVDVVNRRTWISVIVRDEEGQFVAAFQKKWECLFTPKMAEALAIREALQWLKIVGLQAVLVESDAQLVINSLAEHACMSSFDHLVQDIRNLASNFLCISFMLVKQSANRVTHLLTREALLIADRREWREMPPSSLVSTIDSDLN